jgi:hypothetical protein
VLDTCDYIRGYTEFTFADLLEMTEDEMEFFKDRARQYYAEMKRIRSKKPRKR